MTDVRFDVVGMGNAIVDVISPVDEPFLENWQITKNAMTLIEEDRAETLTNAAEGQFMPGGSGANTIAGVASFGGRAAYIGKVAEDTLGQSFRSSMQAGGVPFDTPALVDGPATARSIIFVTPDGARSMNTYLGASVMFGPEDVDTEAIRSAALLYLEGYLFDKEAAKAAFVHAAEIAASAGRKTALTLSDGFCVDRHRASFRHLIRGHIDILFANEDELLSLYETRDFDEAVATLKGDATLAAITRGEKGSVVVSAKGVFSASAIAVEKVVDTTGAGDQYAAGFLFGLSRNLPLDTCAKLGHLAASEVISHYGPRPEVSLGPLAKDAGLI